MDPSHGPAAPPVPRPAATVLVVRDAPAGGVEVAVLLRSAAMRAAPGFVVFPGGIVDPEDEELALRWFGSTEQAARACAVRELAEETGLVLTSRAVVPRGDITRLHQDPPPAATLREVGHWVAPEFLPHRYDAMFFVLRVNRDLPLRPNPAEADRAWWASPADLLDAYERGEISLLWPTLRMLQALATCRSADDALRLRVEQEPPPVGATP